MSPQIEVMVREIHQKIPAHGTPEAAAAAYRQSIERVIGSFPEEMEPALSEALDIVRETLGAIEIIRRRSIIKPREDWYVGPAPTDLHWPALKAYLENVKDWEPSTIASIDESSSEIVSLFGNPSAGQFRCKGLVVGHVQSGKTANMTAVIAKAVDAGYNLIVLLGGMTNKLRAQTQGRLESDVVERHRHLWQLYTTAEDEGDFVRPANGQFTMPVAGRAQLVVMKKEVNRFAQFLRTIERTSPKILRSLKTLLIDDECDQASVDTSRPDQDPTRINEGIRKIIRALPAVSYVGYTATPFANVFINPHEEDDLYPEDFITDLPKPVGYFGAREVFGHDPDDAENEDGESAGRDMIRTIPAGEVERLRPLRRKDRDEFFPDVTPELESALLWFLLSCAVRRRRGHADAHMSMLVHTSPYVDQHARMADAIRKWLLYCIDNLKGRTWARLASVWRTETARVPLDGEGEHSLTLEELEPWIREVIERYEVVVENGVSEERLDYGNAPKTYIVVGGSVLARGLTLEGLTVSFFLRTSPQYDTLLQMGRWFGYRFRYADLPRLWTTEDLSTSFRSLARIENEIREDIAIYRVTEGETPLSLAVRVRQIPGMAITAKAKMRHAYRTSVSYDGRHVQTIRFDHLTERIVSGNWSAASELVDAALDRGEFDRGRMLFTGVPLSAVRNFLRRYDICDRHMDLSKDMLLEYLEKGDDRLSAWNIGVIVTNRGSPSRRALGSLGEVPTNRRSRLAGSDKQADIKALMSKRDILIDATSEEVGRGDSWADLKCRRPGVPLLLLYPIEAKSSPSQRRRQLSGAPARAPLDAVGDLIGIGIVFPGSPDRSGGYFAVELDIPTPEQLDDEERMDADTA
ncbi:MAG: Z1 domain-containing protein [Xanthomonadaceae bacterium]|jgi:hypothetical protein|nr:Z1 domain-containing protein [Xanthomonadaceae bacterium]